MQSVGKSQSELLQLTDEILQEDCHLTIKQCGGDQVYVYIDDGIFTGTQVIRDITNWLQKEKVKPGCQIYVYHVAQHNYGFRNFKKIFLDLGQMYGVHIISDQSIKINSTKLPGYNPEVAWPIEEGCMENSRVKVYCERLKIEHIKAIENKCSSEELEEKVRFWTRCLFRQVTKTMSDHLCTNFKSRDILEHVFLDTGIKLINEAKNPEEDIRPLGYEKLQTLGSGSFFITYRNIANNCP